MNSEAGIPVNAAGVYSNVRGSVNVPLGLALKAAVVALSHDNSFWSRAKKSILREVERLKPNGFGQNAGLCGAKANILYINN